MSYRILISVKTSVTAASMAAWLVHRKSGTQPHAQNQILYDKNFTPIAQTGTVLSLKETAQRTRIVYAVG